MYATPVHTHVSHYMHIYSESFDYDNREANRGHESYFSPVNFPMYYSPLRF